MPTAPLGGNRRRPDATVITNITRERELPNPKPLAKRFTKFKQNFEHCIQIPKNLVHPSRAVQDNRHWLDGIKEIPED